MRKVPPFEARKWSTYTITQPRIGVIRRDWTHDEEERLNDLLDRGLSYVEIGRVLGRSAVAVRIRQKRRRIPGLTRRLLILTARQVRTLLGKGCSKSVVRWIEMGWLKARAANRERRDEQVMWRIQWDDLMAFLRDEHYWMAWEAGRITDAELRAEMTALRAGRPRWLSVGEVAERYTVDIGTVKQWIYKGFLPAQRYGNHFIRESDLDGWLPPCERSKVGIPKRMGRRVVGKERIEAYER